jgi:hypothetical protein
VEPVGPLHRLGQYAIFPPESAPAAPAAPAAPPSGGDGQPTVQASLRVSAPGDVYEQEADRMADMVMRSPAGPDDEPTERSTGPDMPSYYVQRAPSGAALNVSPEVEGDIGRMQGGGQPLPAGERSFFENRFGHDFSTIRIHADNHAVQTSRALNARAFTVGTDIAFDSGEYQPGTESGRHLLAHELTHTIQQTGGVATKQVQRKAADEEADQAPAPEDAPAEQKSPVDLVSEAVQKLTDGEVAQQAVPPIEAQPVALPEHKPEDTGGSAGGGGGGEAAAAPAPQHQAAAFPAAAEESAPRAKAPAAPAPAAAAPAGPAALEVAPAPKAAEPAPASAPATAEPSSTAPEARASTPTSTDKPAPAPEAKAPEGQAQPNAPAEANAAPGAEQTQTEEQAEPEPAEAEAKQARGADAAPKAAVAASGAPDPGAEDAGEPDDERQRVQRMPAGRVIQRAPRSPEADPAFQAVTTSVKSTATEQKQHPPAEQKANESAAAAKMPQEEKLGAAQNTQTTAIDAAAASQEQAAQGGRAPGFDKEAFKASVKARIDQLTPQDPQADGGH